MEVRPQEILENNVGVRPVRHDIEDGRHPHAVACRDVRLHLLGSFEARSARGQQAQCQRLGAARCHASSLLHAVITVLAISSTMYLV